MFVGGCAGSTSGGIKVMRLVILFKQAVNEMKLLLHPRGVFALKMSGSMVKKDIVYSVSGFFFLYAAVLLAVTVITASAGHDITTSFTAALTTLGSIGPGFGKSGLENFSFFEDYIKWALSFAMLVGRLELYTVLVSSCPGSGGHGIIWLKFLWHVFYFICIFSGDGVPLITAVNPADDSCRIRGGVMSIIVRRTADFFISRRIPCSKCSPSPRAGSPWRFSQLYLPTG